MKLLRIIIVSALLISTVVIGVVYAADGSGTNTVSPTSTSAGSTGGTYTFTYTATEAMNSGAITLTIPSGWTAPQGTAGTPGYTTVASTGTVGNVLDNADSLTGWARRTTNPTACSGGLTVDTAVKQEGTGSIKCVNSSDKNNGVWYKNITAQNWSAYTRVGFWIRLNSPINNGDLQFAYDNNNNLASPIAELSFGNSIPADTWTYVSFNLTGTRTSVASFGMKIANLSAMGNTTVWVDNFLLGASSGITPVFSGNTIIINALNLTAGQTITITYGSGGGTSGVTAPSTGGVYTFTTQSKISAGGALTNISSSPTVTVTPVGNPVPAINSISPTSKIIGSSEFSMTIDGSNFISSSVVRFNGSDRVTTYVSASQLTAVIPASDLTSTGAFNITVFNPTPGGGTSNTKIFTVEPKPAVKFVIIDPADATAGDTITVTVQAQNEDGAVVATYQNDVRLVASGSATGAGLVAITNGVGTKDITDTVAETVNLSLEDSEATGLDISSTQNVIFSPGAVVQLNITNPGDTTAGTRLAYTVTREDIYGNLVTTGSTTVYLYTNSTGGLGKFYDAASGGNQIMSVDISGGSSAGFWYEEGRAGSWTVTVSDSASAPDGTTGIDDASDGVTVAAAATSKFVLNNPGDMTAGTRLAYTVTRYDAFDNLSVSGSDTVYLYSSSTGSDAFYDSASGGSQITSVAISSGSSANFWYSDDTAGSWTITASDNASAPDGNTGIDDGTDPVQVSDAPITATKIEISDPADGTVGDNILVTVRALDDSNNLDTDYSGSVTLITSGSATGGGAVTISGGVGTATITDTVAEIVNLTLTDSGGTGLNVSSTQNVAFAAGPVSQISITDAGNGSAGTRLAYTITRKDQYGNLVTAGSTTIYLYTNSTGASGKFYDAASGGSQIASVTIGASSSSADFWYEETSSGSWTVTASDNNSTPDGATGIADASDGVTISPAPLAKFVLNDPGDMTAGNRLGYVVTRYDAFDNPVTSDSTTVYLYSNSTGTTKAFYTVASGGDPVVSISIPAGTSFNNFWYYDDLAGTFTITSSDNSSAPDGDAGVDDGTDSLIVSLLPITATKLVIQDPADGEVGDVIQVTIRAVNDSGDLDTSYNNAVTLNTTGSATGGGLVNIVNGIGVANITDEVAETITLSLADTEGTGLNVSLTQNVIFAATGGITPPPPPPPPSPGGGGSVSPPPPLPPPPAPTFGVVFTGLAFPESRVDILGYSLDNIAHGVLLDQSRVSATGEFSLNLNDPKLKSPFYVLSLTDKESVTGQYKIFVNLPDFNTLQDIIFAPTISLLRSSIRHGDFIVVKGYANPGSSIEAEIDGEVLAGSKALASADGSYSMIIPTAGMQLGKHFVRVRQILTDFRVSEFSVTKSFTLSNIFRPENTDLNDDGAVDIRDVNIFLSSWLSSNPEVRLKNDFNRDGVLDIQDLSIFAQSLRR